MTQRDGSWDYIVIGGGSAGAVMAARLSEVPANRVVLLEAGRDTPPGDEGDEVRDTFYRAVYNRRNTWPDIMAQWQPLPITTLIQSLPIRMTRAA